MSDVCVFCEIANHREPASIVFQDDLKVIPPQISCSRKWNFLVV